MAKKNNKEDNYSTVAISEKLEALYQLQNVDSQIDNLKVLRGELPLEVSDLEAVINKLNDRLELQQGEGDELNNSIMSQKQKIEDAQALIEKYNAQQMKVRNNREFDAINKELEFQGLEIELANKKILSFEQETGEHNDKIKLLKSNIREKKKHLKSKKSELEVIIGSTETEEKKLVSKKKKIEKGIEERLVGIYQNLRLASKNGLAVVKVDRGACGGCFNSITSQHQLNIKLRKDILFCENCGRILVPDDISE